MDSVDCLDDIFRKTIFKAIEKKLFENIFSFDYYDCKKYSFEYQEQIYSLNTDIVSSDACKSQVYFSGRDKGRFTLLYNIAKKLSENGVEVVYRIPDITDLTYQDNLKNIKHLPGMVGYEDILNEISQSNVILDLVQKNQSGISWRVIEAICMNKKLLTNNKSIIKNRYYNPKWMQIFDNVEEIDCEWIKEPCDINYNYENDYSPEYFILNKILRHE